MEQKHSRLGIVSFITSIVAGIFIFLLSVTAGAMVAGGIGKETAGATIVGLLLFAFMFLCLVALGFGIAGLIQKDRKKIFAILGTIFSAVTLVGTISILIIGSAMG